MKAVTYLYDDESPENMAIFQDSTSQIRGFSFTQSQFANLKKQNHVENAGIYFLFSEDEEQKFVYVGQSVNGVSRIQSHISAQKLWNRAMLFVTDNANFSRTAIDYLEYHFIQFFKDKDSNYTLSNKDMREKKPVTNDFERPALEESAHQIEFLLACQGITKQKERTIAPANQYKAQGEYKATLAVTDGKFVLLKGSVIHFPKENVKEWRRNPYERYAKRFEQVIEDGKGRKIDEKTAKLTTDITFKTPSGAAVLVSGRSENGWTFWKGLEDVRQELEKQT